MQEKEINEIMENEKHNLLDIFKKKLSTISKKNVFSFIYFN